MDARTVLEQTIAILLVLPQKGDRLLFFSLRGRPRGRNVLASPNVTAISVCHSD